MDQLLHVEVARVGARRAHLHPLGAARALGDGQRALHRGQSSGGNRATRLPGAAAAPAVAASAARVAAAAPGVAAAAVVVAAAPAAAARRVRYVVLSLRPGCRPPQPPPSRRRPAAEAVARRMIAKTIPIGASSQNHENGSWPSPEAGAVPKCAAGDGRRADDGLGRRAERRGGRRPRARGRRSRPARAPGSATKPPFFVSTRRGNVAASSTYCRAGTLRASSTTRLRPAKRTVPSTPWGWRQARNSAPLLARHRAREHELGVQALAARRATGRPRPGGRRRRRRGARARSRAACTRS